MLELKMLNCMRNQFGLSVGVLFAMDKLFKGSIFEQYSNINVTHSYWDHLVHSGFPFVKVELIRENPTRANIAHWRMLFERFGASVEACLSHMTAPRAARAEDGTTTSRSVVFDTPAGAGMLTRAEAQDAGILGDLASAKKTKSELAIILSELNRVRLGAIRRRRARRSAASNRDQSS
jgi:hypothetical protein